MRSILAIVAGLITLVAIIAIEIFLLRFAWGLLGVLGFLLWLVLGIPIGIALAGIVTLPLRLALAGAAVAVSRRED